MGYPNKGAVLAKHSIFGGKIPFKYCNILLSNFKIIKRKKSLTIDKIILRIYNKFVTIT